MRAGCGGAAAGGAAGAVLVGGAAARRKALLFLFWGVDSCLDRHSHTGCRVGTDELLGLPCKDL